MDDLSRQPQERNWENFIEPISPFRRAKRKTNPQKHTPYSVQRKTSFNISPQHMGFLIEQQRQRDMQIITTNQSLNQFYKSLMNLFMITYTSSQIIVANIFTIEEDSLNVGGPLFFSIILDVTDKVWSNIKMFKLKVMAQNVITMAPSKTIFQRKIQFVCRKITLNMNIRKKIETANFSHEIMEFWDEVQNIIKDKNKIEFLQEMFQQPASRLAYWYYLNFVNDYLCLQQFTKKLYQCHKIHQISQYEADFVQKFTFEFKVIEIFVIIHDYKMLIQEKKSFCQIF